MKALNSSPVFFTDIDLTGILESLPEDNVVGLNGFNLTDFEPGVGCFAS